MLCLCLSAGRACRRVLGLPDLGRKDGKTERQRAVSVCAAAVRVCLQGVGSKHTNRSQHRTLGTFFGY